MTTKHPHAVPNCKKYPHADAWIVHLLNSGRFNGADGAPVARKLYQALGIHEVTGSRLRTRAATPSHETLGKLLRVAGITYEEYCAGPPRPKQRKK